MTNPKDPQAELSKAILKAFGVESDEQYVDNKAKFLIEDLLPVFQAHQQELLSELLGELPEKEYYGNGTAAIGTQFAGFNAAIDQVVELLNRKIGELNG